MPDSWKRMILKQFFCAMTVNRIFTLIPLPKEAQFSVINGMVADDFDGDGNLDLLMNGNDYGTEVTVGSMMHLMVYC